MSLGGVATGFLMCSFSVPNIRSEESETGNGICNLLIFEASVSTRLS